MPKLHNWSIVGVDRVFADAVIGRESIYIHGLLTGHNVARLNGKIVYTSRVVRVQGSFVVTTSGTLYELCKVLPEYEAKFPNAKERLFKCSN